MLVQIVVYVSSDSCTVVPGTAGHRWDIAIVSARGRWPLMAGTGSDKKVQVHGYLNVFVIPVTQTVAIRTDKANVLRDWDAGCRANMQNMCELCAAYIYAAICVLPQPNFNAITRHETPASNLFRTSTHLSKVKMLRFPAIKVIAHLRLIHSNRLRII